MLFIQKRYIHLRNLKLNIMIPKQKIMDMLFEEIDAYQDEFNVITNTEEQNQSSIDKAQALIDFTKKVNAL